MHATSYSIRLGCSTLLHKDRFFVENLTREEQNGKSYDPCSFHWGFWCFLWRLCDYILPLRCVLKQLHINGEQSYAFRMQEDEIPEHLFMYCSFTRAVWFGFPLDVLTHTLTNILLTNWILGYLNTGKRLGRHMQAITLGNMVFEKPDNIWAEDNSSKWHHCFDLKI